MSSGGRPTLTLTRRTPLKSRKNPIASSSKKKNGLGKLSRQATVHEYLNKYIKKKSTKSDSCESLDFSGDQQ